MWRVIVHNSGKMCIAFLIKVMTENTSYSEKKENTSCKTQVRELWIVPSLSEDSCIFSPVNQYPKCVISMSNYRHRINTITTHGMLKKWQTFLSFSSNAFES